MTVRDGSYFLLTDQVGTLRAVADTSGNIVKRIDYDSFGNVLSDTNPSFSVPFGFAGGLHDRDTGLVRFGYRDYSPELGRFVAKDPIDFAGGDTNLYAYSMSDPVNWVDPLGLDFLPLTDPVPGVEYDEAGNMIGESGLEQPLIDPIDIFAGGVAGWYKTGAEVCIGRNFRLAPFGNRWKHKFGRWFHYHRRGAPGPNGQPPPGQGIGRHRPFEPSQHDRHWWDRF